MCTITNTMAVSTQPPRTHSTSSSSHLLSLIFHNSLLIAVGIEYPLKEGNWSCTVKWADDSVSCRGTFGLFVVVVLECLLHAMKDSTRYEMTRCCTPRKQHNTMHLLSHLFVGDKPPLRIHVISRRHVQCRRRRRWWRWSGCNFTMLRDVECMWCGESAAEGDSGQDGQEELRHFLLVGVGRKLIRDRRRRTPDRPTSSSRIWDTSEAWLDVCITPSRKIIIKASWKPCFVDTSHPAGLSKHLDGRW